MMDDREARGGEKLSFPYQLLLLNVRREGGREGGVIYIEIMRVKPV